MHRYIYSRHSKPFFTNNLSRRQSTYFLMFLFWSLPTTFPVDSFCLKEYLGLRFEKTILPRVPSSTGLPYMTWCWLTNQVRVIMFNSEFLIAHLLQSFSIFWYISLCICNELGFMQILTYSDLIPLLKNEEFK